MNDSSFEISRDEFVEIIFDSNPTYAVDTLYSAVEIGDRFIEKSNTKYTIDLVHAATNLIAKVTEDFSDFCTKKSVIETESENVISLEWEIAISFGFEFRSKNFITLASSLICSDKFFHSCFWDLTKQICLSKQLMGIDKRTLLCGIIFLILKGKLAAKRANRERIFKEIIEKCSKEFDVPLIDIIRKIKHE